MSTYQRPEQSFSIELRTALHMGSGDPEGGSDAGVVRDFNGLPGLPGPGLQGLLRSTCLEHPACGVDASKRLEFVERVFGYTGGKGRKPSDGKTDDPGRGGRVWVGWGVIHNQNNKPQSDWIRETELKRDPVLADAVRSVLRDQVKISARGAADDKAKFDQIVVNPGHRFTFTIKFATAPNDQKAWQTDWQTDWQSDWQTLLTVLRDPALRLGGKTRRGLGGFKIITEGYAQHAESKLFTRLLDRPIAPASLWMFGGGKAIDDGTKQPDSVPVSCRRIDWSGTTGIPRPVWLIPGTGIKGPLVHRTLFHANLKKGIFIGETAPPGAEEEVNRWMCQLFGGVKGNTSTIGKIVIDDHFLDQEGHHKVPSAPTQMHVKINPFTGGASDKALFSDQPLQAKAAMIPLRIEVRGQVDPDALACFESALDDLDQGRLALGAHSSRGYGRFKKGTPGTKELP